MNAVDIVLNAIDATGSTITGIADDLDEVGTKAEAAGNKMKTLGGGMAKVGAAATVGITAPLAAAGLAAINSASDLQETMGVVDTVFGDQAASVQAWAASASTSIGAAEADALEMASSLAIVGETFGVAGDDSAAFGTQMTQLAADLGSFYNMSTEDAAAALSAGIKGNVEQLENFNIVMSAATVEQKALEMGLAATKAELTDQDKAQARMAIIMEQSSLAAGNFAETSTGLANSQKILSAELANLSTSMGETFLPIAEAVVAKVTEAVQWFTGLSPAMQQNIAIAAAIAAAIGPVVIVLGGVVSAIGTLLPLFGALASGLGLIFSPVGLVVAALAGLVAIMFDVGGANEKVATTLENMGFAAAAEAVRGLHEWTSSLVEVMKGLFDGSYSLGDVFEANTPDWISSVLDFKWPSLTVPTWVSKLMGWAWPLLGPIAWIVKLTSWAWPTIAAIPWIVKLTDWEWPQLPDKPKWLSDLLDWKWPSMPALRLPGRGGDGSGATGTLFSRAGTMLVGETGPELVSLPRGSQILPAGPTRRLMAGGAGGSGNVYVTVNATVNNDGDLTTLARRVGREIQRRAY